jgi:hypothetical protein
LIGALYVPQHNSPVGPLNFNPDADFSISKRGVVIINLAHFDQTK